jgi:hypothetical protein
MMDVSVAVPRPASSMLAEHPMTRLQFLRFFIVWMCLRALATSSELTERGLSWGLDEDGSALDDVPLTPGVVFSARVELAVLDAWGVPGELCCLQFESVRAVTARTAIRSPFRMVTSRQWAGWKVPS